MANQCPHCGAAIAAPMPDSCPACLKALAIDTGITANRSPGMEGSFAEGVPPEPPMPSFERDTPSIVRPEATGPPCPPLLLVMLSISLCAAQGAMANWGGPGGLAFRSDETLLGGGVGLVVGWILAVDHRLFRRKLNKPTQIPGDDDAPTDSPGPIPPPSEWIAIAMLVLPVVVGTITLFGSTLRIPQLHLGLIGSGTIVATAVLGYFSIRQLALRMDRSVTYHGAFSSPAYVYLALLFFWLVFFPAHFFVRRRMGGKNLIIPAFIATAAFCAPILEPLLVEAELPTVDDPQVTGLVKQSVEQHLGVRPADLKNPVEVSFNDARQTRVGRCMLATKRGDEPVDYTITWQNRSTGMWQVQVLPILTTVDSKEVIVALEGLAGPGAVTIVNPTQTSYDHAKQIRTGQANAVLGERVVRITYTVEWDNRNAGMSQVKIQP